MKITKKPALHRYENMPYPEAMGITVVFDCQVTFDVLKGVLYPKITNEHIGRKKRAKIDALLRG